MRPSHELLKTMNALMNFRIKMQLVLWHLSVTYAGSREKKVCIYVYVCVNKIFFDDLKLEREKGE